jgi:hypothetical protein
LINPRSAQALHPRLLSSPPPWANHRASFPRTSSPISRRIHIASPRISLRLKRPPSDLTPPTPTVDKKELQQWCVLPPLSDHVPLLIRRDRAAGTRASRRTARQAISTRQSSAGYTSSSSPSATPPSSRTTSSTSSTRTRAARSTSRSSSAPSASPAAASSRRSSSVRHFPVFRRLLFISVTWFESRASCVCSWLI